MCIRDRYFTGDTLSLKVKNMPLKSWDKFQKNNKEERDKKIARGEPYDYKKVGDGIGLLSIYAFSAPDIESYNRFLFKTFKTIHKDATHSLIIDIRGNFGGWPKIASHLFHFISNTYFKTMAKSRLKVSAAFKNNLFKRYPSLRNNGGYIQQRRHYMNINAIISLSLIHI